MQKNEDSNVHIFLGKANTGKTRALRNAVEEFLIANNGSTYSVLGDDHEYRFEGHGSMRKIMELDVSKGGFEIVTTADLFILPRINYMLDLGFLRALIDTGKPVFVEMLENGDSVETFKRWESQYNEEAPEPYLLATKIHYYLGYSSGVRLNKVEREIAPIKLDDQQETPYVFHECVWEEDDDY